ncbi:hypothetical protein [Leminorella grimontii]|uniref:hypothetical protein n=1 Tax=Leminorella grimontii TaxID=82981 RepID=UPI00106B1E81|nr:hypothetical protein [Leminorella grimontii]
MSNEQGDAELQVNNEGLSVSGSNPIGSARLSGMVPAKNAAVGQSGQNPRCQGHIGRQYNL